MPDLKLGLAIHWTDQPFADVVGLIEAELG